MTSGPARRASAAEHYGRRVVTVFGLPFDVVDVAGAVGTLRAAAFENRRCFVSTPNLNFAVAARRDAAFRGTVLRSDLSLADGMPIVALAKAEGLRLPERVAGATVFDALRAHAGPPLGVYFFGGPPGAAQAAARKLDAEDGGLRCVGFEAGGFGPVESLGDAGTVDRINRSGAHFVVASLGAVKGQAWLERHAQRLNAPLLCHLGAVLNFAAERIRRAPAWMQRAGLEWAWRIREEPSLWRRYSSDAAAACRLVLPRLASRGPSPAAPRAPTIDVDGPTGRTRIVLGGDWTRAALDPLRRALAETDGAAGSIRIDLAAVTSVDAALVGLLQLVEGRRGGAGVAVMAASPQVAAAFRRCMADEILAGSTA